MSSVEIFGNWNKLFAGSDIPSLSLDAFRRPYETNKGWIRPAAIVLGALAAMAGPANANTKIITSFEMVAENWSGNTGNLATDTEISSTGWIILSGSGGNIGGNTGPITSPLVDGLTTLPIGVGDKLTFSYQTGTGTITASFTENFVSTGGSTRFYMNIFADGTLTEGGSPLTDTMAAVVFELDPGFRTIG